LPAYSPDSWGAASAFLQAIHANAGICSAEVPVPQVYPLEAISYLGFVGRGFTGCGKIRVKAAFSSTGTLACTGFAALIIDAHPRAVVLLDFFRSLFSRDIKRPTKNWVLESAWQRENVCGSWL
jgi:hypothetical protein